MDDIDRSLTEPLLILFLSLSIYIYVTISPQVTTAWAILIPLGLGIFVLARDDVKKRRRDIMLSKKRMFEPLALEDSQRYQESEIYRPREEKQDAEG